MKAFICIVMSNSHRYIYLFFSNSIYHHLLLNHFSIFYLNNILYLPFNLPTIVVFTRELKAMARETIFIY